MEVDVEKLRELRRKKVLSLGELAKEAGVHRNTLTRVENGEPAYPATIRKIARALDVEPTELVKS
jgi:transcriptional regulator with XRE-family HTH domain